MQQHLATYSNLTLKSNKPIPLFKARDCDQLTLDFLAYRERYSNIRFIEATPKVQRTLQGTSLFTRGPQGPDPPMYLSGLTWQRHFAYVGQVGNNKAGKAWQSPVHKFKEVKICSPLPV